MCLMPAVINLVTDTHDGFLAPEHSCTKMSVLAEVGADWQLCESLREIDICQPLDINTDLSSFQPHVEWMDVDGHAQSEVIW